ncbi:MAG: DUF2800 domain-containing protein, partial [Oscillospiraceae bacterium]|nr:DUF2800 domain-containing protein [Oscillospiraceae bacterium]
GYAESMLYERKPLSLTGIEKLLGKKAFSDILSEYITMSPGKLTLAPIDDKRQAFTNKISAKEVFNKEEK